MSENKDRFFQEYQQYISREGNVELLDWLDKRTDFFYAPASTKFHGAFAEGLVIHSLNVFDLLKARCEKEPDVNMESIAIVSLLHDVCKTEFYKESTRNVKNEDTGRWEKVPYYSIEDRFPFGHGEKSVFLIERFMRLKPAEAIAIRWHMGGFDDNARLGGYSVANAFGKYPLAVKLHLCDLEATYLLENQSE
ncbi:MAG: hydrolase [Oscillospiraceae bacterium]|nr:hydrolase [Oscillospiraceae bacterium]